MDRSLEPLMILVAGPYRSGTGDDPGRMAEHLRAMEAYASHGADLMVRVARERGLAVFSSLREAPGCG